MALCSPWPWGARVRGVFPAPQALLRHRENPGDVWKAGTEIPVCARLVPSSEPAAA